MRRRFVVTSFQQYKHLSLLNKARQVVAALTGNANFTTPVPSLSIVTRAADSFENALALPNSKEATAVRTQTRGEVIKLLNALANYVQQNSNGSVTIMLTSGFDVNRLPGKIGQLQQPSNFRVTAKPGQSVHLRTNAIYGAHSYNFEYALITNNVIGEWKTCQSTKSFTTIYNLQKSAEYAFRVAGVGAYPVLTYSDVLVSVIL